MPRASDPALRRRARIAAGLLALAGLGAALMAAEAEEAARRAIVASWVLQAEELAGFARSALASRDELLLIQRLGALGKRDEIAYVVIQDPAGVARFAGRAEEAGRTFGGATARRASAASALLVQPLPGVNALEVDVPLGGAVLRVCYSFRPLVPLHRWLWGGATLACAALAGAGLALLRRG